MSKTICGVRFLTFRCKKEAGHLGAHQAVGVLMRHILFTAAFLLASGCCSHGNAIKLARATLHEVRVNTLENPKRMRLDGFHTDKDKAKRLLDSIIERVKADEELLRVATGGKK